MVICFSRGVTNMKLFLFLSLFLVHTQGCQPPDCDHPDCGSCGEFPRKCREVQVQFISSTATHQLHVFFIFISANACCEIKFSFSELSVFFVCLTNLFTFLGNKEDYRGRHRFDGLCLIFVQKWKLKLPMTC